MAVLLYICRMNYTLTSKQVTVAADDFIRRYRDVERIGHYCRQCPGYGMTWSCPPFDFDPCTVSDGFKTVTLMATVISFDEQTRAACKTAEQSAAMGRKAMEEVWQSLLPQLMEMERQAPRSRVFTFRCRLCSEGCTRPEGKPCRHPDRLRYSLEAVGFDVSAAARDLLDIELEWSSDGSLTRHITLLTALFMRQHQEFGCQPETRN